jgi:NADH:ubiquinone oxidoreductase subunit F (NADH-binding)
MERLAKTMTFGSFCGLGQTAAKAVMSTYKSFRTEFEEHMDRKCSAGICKFEKGGL